jgi:integrase
VTQRSRGEGTIYRRAGGAWAGQVYVFNRAGGRQRRTVYGATQAEVVDKLTHLRALTHQRLPAAPERLTLAQYADAWLSHGRASALKPATVSNYRWLLNTYTLPRLGPLQLTSLTPQHVRDLMAAVLESGASARTAQLTRAVLRALLADAERDQIVARNVAALVKGPRVDRPEARPWPAPDAAAFLAATRAHRLHALFAVGVALGLRKGELIALRWADVDLDAATVRVTRTTQRLGAGQGLVTGTPKTARGRRTIPLPQVCATALHAHRHAQDADRRAAGDLWVDTGLVFTTTRGGGLEPRNLNRTLDSLIKTAGVPRIRFHDLRHTCASLLLAQGVQPRVVMEILGHSQLAITTDLYSHVMPTTLRAAAHALDTALAPLHPDGGPPS